MILKFDAAMLLTERKYIFLLVLCLLHIKADLYSQSPYTTPVQIKTINATKSANEGDMYLDTNNNDYYIGLTTGELAKIGDTLDEKIDSVYLVGDSLIIVEGDDTLVTDLNIGIERLIVLDTNINLTGWSTPWNEVPLEAFNVIVPDSGWLMAEYYLIVNTNDDNEGFGLKVNGYTAGDFISGIIDISDYNPPSNSDGGDFYKILLNNTNFDIAPGTTREINSRLRPENSEALVRINVRYRNLSGSPVTFGYSFGGEDHSNQPALNISVLAGSSLRYTLY